VSIVVIVIEQVRAVVVARIQSALESGVEQGKRAVGQIARTLQVDGRHRLFVVEFGARVDAR
jgi:hypothetical protein